MIATGSLSPSSLGERPRLRVGVGLGSVGLERSRPRTQARKRRRTAFSRARIDAQTAGLVRLPVGWLLWRGRRSPRRRRGRSRRPGSPSARCQVGVAEALPLAISTIAPKTTAPITAPRKAPTIPCQKRSGRKTVKCQRAMPIVNQTSSAISDSSIVFSRSSRACGAAGGVRGARALRSRALGRGRIGRRRLAVARRLAAVAVAVARLGGRDRAGRRAAPRRSAAASASISASVSSSSPSFASSTSSAKAGTVPSSCGDPLAAAGEAGLAFLPGGQHRRGDEDRRVGTGEDPDHHREGEVLQGRAAEDQQRADREAGSRGWSTSDRVSTSLIERLTICEKAARGIRGMFSRIRSKTMIVS